MIRRFRFSTICLVCLVTANASSQDIPNIDGIDAQPLLAHAARVSAALDQLRSPLAESLEQRLAALRDAPRDASTARAVQELLDPHCIAFVHINPEARVKVIRTVPGFTLPQGGWASFLVKVHNEAGVQSALEVSSPNAEPVVHRSSGAPRPREANLLTEGQVDERFLEAAFYRGRPLNEELSGFAVEYAVLQLYTNDLGEREIAIALDAGKGTEDLGMRNLVNYHVTVEASVKVVLRVKDFDGAPAMASFIIRDNIERIASDLEQPFATDYRHAMSRRRPWEGNSTKVTRLSGLYPLPSRRVAAKDEYPDFFFQPQVYRADGEHVNLPPGEYTVSFTRGPEYIAKEKTITVPEGVEEFEAEFELERWIHLADLGWFSADHHVHAGGCSHYESPEAGVNPASMYRQALGEDLNVACVLTWGPCWYHQKSFFEGKINSLSSATNLIRYDVEVSGFPSSHAGHICLLRLTEDDYPGTTLIEEWPSWGLPVMQWAQSQNGVTGYAHSGWGLEPQEPTDHLPNYVIPKFDGIGANEYIVTVTHGACDFISAVDTPAPWELNIWYHTLNCGYRARISGETDFPCIFDDRVGMGRSYAPMNGPLVFDEYVQQIKRGANYVSDGKSHIIDFEVNEIRMGENESEVHLDAPARVRVKARVAAYLPEEQDEVGAIIASSPLTSQPYWDVERARIDDSRDVAVELIVNGEAVTRQRLGADGNLHEVSFSTPIERSSWVALRVYPSSHTNPIFVLVDGEPIRASKRSAQWCIDSVDRCWEMKQEAIRESERSAAKAAYDFARAEYERILAESSVD